MFNDDVQAICPMCNGSDVSYDSIKISCRGCDFEEAFGIASNNQTSALQRLNADQMMIVLRRWQFAG